MKICNRCHTRFRSSRWQCPSCQAIPENRDGYLVFSPGREQVSEGFRPDAFERLYNAEANNFWFQSRSLLIEWALRQYFPWRKNLLEIGCGTGFVLSGIERTFPQISLYGSDIYSAGLSYAAKRLKKAELFQMDARTIPFENEFDVIGAFDVLEHIAEDGLVLSQIYRAVRAGGGVILTVPQHQFLWSKVDEHACHVRRYNAQILKLKVQSAGFEIVKMTSFMSLPFPLMMISRLKKRERSDQQPAAEINVNWLINIILKKILDVERGIIRTGISFPFGGSLLVIAKKH